MSDSRSSDNAPATLGEALKGFLEALHTEQRILQERYVRHYVQTFGESHPLSSITGAKVEGYAEAYIKESDPLAEERIIALKSWFQYLRRQNHTQQNFGTVIRVRRSARQPGRQIRAMEAPQLEVTAAGLAAMRDELAQLAAELPQLVSEIARAREDKDFRENAPLDAAREALAQNEARRKQLESDLGRARVVDGGPDDRAGVGSVVSVTRLDTGARATYQLVGAREANAREGKISIDSPVGARLLGKRAGDEVSVETPNGELVLRLDDVGSG